MPVRVRPPAPIPAFLFETGTSTGLRLDLPQPLAVWVSADAIKQMNRLSLEHAKGPISVYLTSRDLSPQEVSDHRRRQSIQPVNIIVLGPNRIREIVQAANPTRRFVQVILEQSDLTKVSPFILSNAAPQRMFYGRDSEAATILTTLPTNSVALLGSRRIGKTSLLRKVSTDLLAANFLPFFADCQTVRTWQDFADLARSHWNVEVPNNFRPLHLRQLVSSLANGSDKLNTIHLL